MLGFIILQIEVVYCIGYVFFHVVCITKNNIFLNLFKIILYWFYK